MSDAKHAWSRDLLAEYLTGGLSNEERTRLEAHTRGCTGCAADLEEIGRHDPSMDEAAPPSPRLRDRALHLAQVVKPGPMASRILMVAALIVLLGVVGFVISEMAPGSKENLIAAASAEVPLAHSGPALTGEIERHRDYFERKGIPKDDQLSHPTDEPAIFFPEAKESDHNESADNEDFRQMKGNSVDFLSYIKGEAGGFRGRQAGKNPGVYDTMGVGVGGGGGGRYGGRFGGRMPDPDEPSKPGYWKPNEQAPAIQGGATTVSRGREPDRVMPLREKKADEAPAVQDEAPKQQRKIIRSGEMEFEIDSFDTSVSTLTKIAIEEQGFVATLNSEKLQNGKVRGTVVVRVPPDHLDTLLLKLRALGDLKSQRIGSEDITKHYTDIESRLRAARTMEERLINIIKEGKGQIKDLLLAEKELGEWRTKIETMVGEINYFNNLISHSTLTITLYEKEIRAPFGVVETERVDMGIEVEDVEKAHRDALAAVAEAKGRVSKSDLKQLNAGQFNATLQFEVAPERAGALRDRLKQLGVLARLDINRSQETQGGSGKPQEIKVRQNDTQMFVSIYNLANVAPRETIQLNLACVDAEKSYRAILDRVEKASGRILSSRLAKPKGDLTTGTLQFHIKAADADAVLLDIRAAGEVMKLDVIEESDTANATRSKRGFNVNVFGLGTVQPRETSTIVLAARDVALGYRVLLEAAKAADARILTAQLNENDRKNMTGTLSFEVRREHEKAVAEAMAKAGDVYTRNSTRAQDVDNVVDSKFLLHFRLFSSANIPARETVKLSIEVGDVEATAKGLEAEFKGRIADARHTREASGQRESALTIDVPLREMPAAVERIKSLGGVREHIASKNTGVPDNELAVARLEVKVSNEILVAHDSGPAANIRRGLAISLQAGSWSLMLVMIGICFVLPLVLVIWVSVKIRRKFAPKAAPAPAAA
jgi:hypothetical protein